jgi:hypothetical protein
MLFYRAALPLSRRTLTFVSDLIRGHRRELGSVWRKLDPGQQALSVPLRAVHREIGPAETRCVNERIQIVNGRLAGDLWSRGLETLRGRACRGTGHPGSIWHAAGTDTRKAPPKRGLTCINMGGAPSPLFEPPGSPWPAGQGADDDQRPRLCL